MIRRRDEILSQIEEREGWLAQHKMLALETPSSRSEQRSLGRQIAALYEELEERERLNTLVRLSREDLGQAAVMGGADEPGTANDVRGD